MSLLDKLSQKIRGARDALAQLTELDQALRRELDALAVERERLVRTMPPKQDVLAALRAEIDAIGRDWVAANGAALLANLSGRVLVAMNGDVEGIAPGSLLTSLPDPLNLRALCAILPSELFAGVSRVLDAVPSEAGPPLAQRPQLLTVIAARIAKVEDEHAALCDEAAATGVTIPLLESVRVRRAVAASRQESLDRQAADAKRRGR